MENKKLPNATAVLILGILSILTCWCYGVFGIIFGGIALLLGRKDSKAYRATPDQFDNYQTLNIGRILSIIGVVLSLITIAIMIWAISIVGLDGIQNEVLARERMQDYFGQ